MANRAAFIIDGAASSPPGFSAVSEQELTLRIETLPATDVLRTQFEITRKDDDAPTIVFPGSGTSIEIAATPTSEVLLDLPTVGGDEAVSYEIVCRVVTAEGEFTYSRVVSVPNALGLRKWIQLEEAEYHVGGWYADHNALVDALATVVAGSISLDHGGLSGLTDDDHVHYELAAPPTTTLTGAANVLALSHLRKWLRVSHGSATELTVPANATVAFPVGSVIRGAQVGAGQLTLAAAGGVTINGVTLVVPAQFGWFELKKVGTDEWDLEIQQAIGSNVIGPSSAIDGEDVVFDGTTGKLIKRATHTITDVSTGERTTTITGIAAGFTAGQSYVNTTAATGGSPNQASPAVRFSSRWWDGTASQTAEWLLQARRKSAEATPLFLLRCDPGDGSSALNTLIVEHTGSTTSLFVGPGAPSAELYIGDSGKILADSGEVLLESLGSLPLRIRAPSGQFVAIDADATETLRIEVVSGIAVMRGVGSGGYNLTPAAPTSEAPGRNVRLIGGDGTGTDQDGGHAIVRAGDPTGSGAPGTAILETHDNHPAVTVGGTAAAPYVHVTWNDVQEGYGTALTLLNATPATDVQNQYTPSLVLSGATWTGSSTALTWRIQGRPELTFLEDETALMWLSRDEDDTYLHLNVHGSDPLSGSAVIDLTQAGSLSGTLGEATSVLLFSTNNLFLQGDDVFVQNGDSANVIQVSGTGATPSLGFFNESPIARPAAYTPTNVTPDRSYDADSTSTAELADVLGTVIADLQAYGLLQ